jgi:hypothetical protein
LCQVCKQRVPQWEGDRSIRYVPTHLTGKPCQFGNSPFLRF